MNLMKCPPRTFMPKILVDNNGDVHRVKYITDTEFRVGDVIFVQRTYERFMIIEVTEDSITGVIGRYPNEKTYTVMRQKI